jgi:hypothetical protein
MPPLRSRNGEACQSSATLPGNLTPAPADLLR